MIASFFSKSKPIHYVIVSVVVFLVFFLTKMPLLEQNFSAALLFKLLGLLVVCILTVFTFDFVASKNSLTKKNSYKLLVFALFFAVLPEVMLHSKILIANFFILLALRRLISVRSGKAVKKKLFDASVWIGVAAMFFFWSILFYLLIFVALFVYSINDIKNWFIPIIGMTTVAIIAAAFMLSFNVDISSYIDSLVSISFDFSGLNSIRFIVGSTILLSYGLWALFYYVKNLKSKSKNIRPSYVLIIFAAIIAIGIVAVSPVKNGSEFLFIFAPLAIILSNYLETIKEQWFKEALLWSLVIIPIALLFL